MGLLHYMLFYNYVLITYVTVYYILLFICSMNVTYSHYFQAWQKFRRDNQQKLYGSLESLNIIEEYKLFDIAWFAVYTHIPRALAQTIIA